MLPDVVTMLHVCCVCCRSVRNACNNLGVLNQRVSNAVKTRKELDLRIGGWRGRWVEVCGWDRWVEVCGWDRWVE